VPIFKSSSSVIQTISTSKIPISQSPEAETLRGQSGLGNSSDGNNDEESSNIIVYPNPTQSELQIYFPQSEGTVQIEIFDMASVQVLNMQQNLQNGKAILPVTSLTPGIYNIRIQQNHKVEYSKFIKN
jgi:hypothetical protein